MSASVIKENKNDLDINFFNVLNNVEIPDEIIVTESDVSKAPSEDPSDNKPKPNLYWIG